MINLCIPIYIYTDRFLSRDSILLQSESLPSGNYIYMSKDFMSYS